MFFNLLLAAAPPISAAPETVVVIAQRAPVPLEQVAVSVSTLERVELDRLGYLSLADALRTLPGVSADNSGGLGKQTSVSLRGESGFRTRVYLDGIELSDVSAPQAETPWSHLLVNGGLRRVEVLRGPQGLAWGADAGGVILLESRDQGFGAALELGRYDTRRANARAGWQGSQGRAALSVGRVETDGINALLADTSGEVDPYSNTTWHGTSTWEPSDHHSISAVWRRERADNDFDRNFGDPPITDLNDLHHRDAGRLAWHYQGPVRASVALQRLETERTSYQDGLFSYAYASTVDALELALAGDNLQFGLDLRDESGGAVGTPLPERKVGGAYAQGAWQLGPLFLNSGLRYDHIEDAGERATWRLGAALPQLLGEHWLKWRASVGSGFRAPSLYEMYYNSALWSGEGAAPELVSERSFGAEFGVDWLSQTGVEAQFTVFYQRVSDAIEFDLDAYSGYLQTGSETQGRGAELALLWPLTDNFRLSGNFTYLRAERADGQPRARRPRRSLNLSLLWQPLPAAEIAVHARSVADIRDVMGETLPNYQILDATCRWALTPTLSLTGRLTNALDENYTEVAGYATYGRAAYVGIAVEL